MGRKKRHEDHINHEAWAIPYGDLVTLLLAFFVVMYSISVVNEGKYRALSESMVAAFRGTPKTTRPIQFGDNPPSGVTEQGLEGSMPRGSVDKKVLSTELDNPQRGAKVSAMQDASVGADLERTAEDIRAALSDLIEEDQVRIRETALWLEVEIKTDLLFPVGVAKVAPQALSTLQEIGDILKPMPNTLRVEGHTDNVPISTSRFPSNWELSSARASSVIRLFQDSGVAPERMVAAGLGEYQPTETNDTADGRNRNRRVTIVILATDEVPEQLPGSLTNTEVGA